jgi:hypothetical protein
MASTPMPDATLEASEVEILKALEEALMAEDASEGHINAAEEAAKLAAATATQIEESIVALETWDEEMAKQFVAAQDKEDAAVQLRKTRCQQHELIVQRRKELETKLASLSADKGLVESIRSVDPQSEAATEVLAQSDVGTSLSSRQSKAIKARHVACARVPAHVYMMHAASEHTTA